MAKFLITPRDTKFYDLFEQDTANLVTAAEKLVDLFNNYEDVEAKARQLKDLEHQGDTITHEIIRRVNLTFVTPIDREDIVLLAHTLDSIMDFMEAAARTAFLYRITQPTERVRQLAAIIAKMAYVLNDVCLPCLRHRDQFNRILEQCVEMNRLENEADDVHHAAMAELFDSDKDAIEIIKWREIYQHMEDATDRGEDVADVLEGIVLKYA